MSALVLPEALRTGNTPRLAGLGYDWTVHSGRASVKANRVDAAHEAPVWRE